MKILIDDKTRLLDSAVREGELAELFTPGLSTGVNFIHSPEPYPYPLPLIDLDVPSLKANSVVIAIANNTANLSFMVVTSAGTFYSETIPIGSYSKNYFYFPEGLLTDFTVFAHSPGQTFINRLAFGMMRSLRTSNTREVGMYSTHQSRQTLSGQVIQGAGGYTGRKVDVDIRYKITDEIFADFEAAYPSQIGRGYPFFIDFSGEKARGTIPWDNLYATMDKPESFLVQSSARRPRYSKRIKFREAF